MSARDTVETIVREALVIARAAGRIRAFQVDEHERALVVEVVTPGVVLAEARHFITIEIYEELHI